MSQPVQLSAGLIAEHLRVRYHPRQLPVIDGESVCIPTGQITALIGPNGSGKSTLLKTLARQLAPETGRIILDGRDITTLPPHQLARRLGILFQENVAPSDLTVERLVYYGRYPYRRLFESLTPEDHDAVEEALRLANIVALRHRPLNSLSAGQKQLAWIAMVLAQKPSYLFLDEPTTFLDLAHRFDVMNLIRRLSRKLGKTIVLAVHDLNLASRYADHILALRNGRIIASGTPKEVLTVEILRAVFDVETRIIYEGESRFPFIIPVGKSQ